MLWLTLLLGCAPLAFGACQPYSFTDTFVDGSYSTNWVRSSAPNIGAIQASNAGIELLLQSNDTESITLRSIAAFSPPASFSFLMTRTFSEAQTLLS